MKRKAWFAVLPGLIVLIAVSGFMLRRAKSTLPSPPGTSADAPGVLALYPGGPFSSELPTISADELKAALDRKDPILLVFVGNRSYFDERRIPGASCVAYGDLAVAFRSVPRDRDIVLYCGCCAGASEGISGAALRALRELGFRRLRHLRGHYAAWQEAGYPSGGSNPVAVVRRSWTPDGADEEIDAFAAETRRRHEELSSSLRHETNAGRARMLREELGRIETQAEIDGLLVKRKHAERAGDPALIAEIDRILKEKGY